MTMTHYCFLQPLDVLFLRGNKLFGDPGSYGESLVPPWPSVAAGALRSRILADDGIDLADFAAGKVPHPVLGTPHAPGPFTVTAFHLARRDVQGHVETLHVLPADLVVSGRGGESMRVAYLTPCRPAAELLHSSPLRQLAVLAENKPGKPVGGYWLNAQGWTKYLLRQPLRAKDHLVEASGLWKLDPRVGIGLEEATGRADDGKLFTVQAVAVERDVGFLIGVSGADLPRNGAVRLGADGRAAALRAIADFKPIELDYEGIAKNGRCRVILATPGIFPDGWKLPGTDPEMDWRLGGVKAKLVAAAVARSEVVSGWDLAKKQPKTAQRAVPAGSVYWLEDLDATPDQLRKLAESGLWLAAEDNVSRRAEGFNRFTFAAP